MRLVNLSVVKGIKGYPDLQNLWVLTCYLILHQKQYIHSYTEIQCAHIQSFVICVSHCHKFSLSVNWAAKCDLPGQPVHLQPM